MLNFNIRLERQSTEQSYHNVCVYAHYHRIKAAFANIMMNKSKGYFRFLYSLVRMVSTSRGCAEGSGAQTVSSL